MTTRPPDIADVRRLAALARLALTDEEAQRLVADLARLLERFAAIAAYPPADAPLPGDAPPPREDRAAPSASPLGEGGRVPVPRVVTP